MRILELQLFTGVKSPETDCKYWCDSHNWSSQSFIQTKNSLQLICQVRTILLNLHVAHPFPPSKYNPGLHYFPLKTLCTKQRKVKMFQKGHHDCYQVVVGGYLDCYEVIEVQCIRFCELLE